jgi:DNA-binding CsgD family transcriptional regulator
MSKSQRLRLRDLRDVYRLIGECRELGHDSRAWRTHAAAGLCDLAGAQVGIVGELHGFRTTTPRMAAVVDHGWTGRQERRNYLEFLKQHGPANNPQYLPLCQLPPGGVITRSRRQLVSDAEWYRSDHFHEQRRPSRIDGSLLSLAVTPGGVAGTLSEQPPTFVLAANRALGDRLFEKRERLLVHWFHYELAPLIGARLATADTPSASSLSPRQRQVLECLLEGESEKQVARRLGLSQHTVHQYVKSVYRHFRVRSRGELLARWVRTGP